MSITTISDAITKMMPPQEVVKVGAATTIGRFYSPFYVAGLPAAASAPTPGLAGASLSSYTNSLSFTSGSTLSGNTYLANFVASCNVAGTLFLCDRLWHNSGILVAGSTVGTGQTINSVQFPPRDNLQSVSGNGVFIGVEVTTVMGAGTPTFGMSYVNTSGTTHSATTAAQSTTMAVGSFIPMPLVSGDTGVQAVSAWTHSVTSTSGAYSLVAYRPIARVDIQQGGVKNSIDAISSGFPKLYNNTVPFLLWLPATATAPNITCEITYSQG